MKDKKRIEQLEKALKVILTWAIHDTMFGSQCELDPKDVMDLCDGTLNNSES